MKENLEEGQIVLCTVTKIIGTTVFVRIEDYNQEGTIITSEIAPGRIRNLRDYVVPNKKIVCRVLRLDKNNVNLSLRRVSLKEKKEVIENYAKEKSIESALKTILKNPENVIPKIKQNFGIMEFYQKAKENPKIMEKLMSKEEASKLAKIFQEKKEKEIIVKKKILLNSRAENGIVKLKKILPGEATYLAAGKFVLTIKDKNYKDANTKMNLLIREIEKKARGENCEFIVEK